MTGDEARHSRMISKVNTSLIDCDHLVLFIFSLHDENEFRDEQVDMLSTKSEPFSR